MSHLFRTGTSVFKVADNIFRVNDKLNVVTVNKGGFGAAIELMRVDPVIANSRIAITSGSTLKIIDTNTFSQIASISMPGAVVGIAWDIINNKLYVSAGGNLFYINTLNWVSTNTGLTGSFNGIALDPNPDNNRLVIAGGTNIYFVNIITHTINVTMTSGFSGAYGLAFDPSSNNRVYIGNYASNYISVVDTDNYITVETISGFNAPIDIAFDSNLSNDRFLVSEYLGGNIAYVSKSTHGIVKRIPVTANPEGISFDPNIVNNRYFVASNSGHIYYTVTEIIT